MSKKIPILVVSACLMWFAYQAKDFLVEVVWAVTSIYSRSEAVDFQIGTGQTITLEMPRSFIPKPYAISLGTEFVDSKNTFVSDAASMLDYPKQFILTVYSVSLWGEKKQINRSVINPQKEIYQRFGMETKNISNIGFSEIFYYKKLPPGKYIFEIRDQSPQKSFHQKTKTSMEAFIYVNLK